MFNGFFNKIKQTVSHRLLNLKEKRSSRAQAAKQQSSAFADWLQQNLGLEALKSYARLVCHWCRFWLGKEARQVYVWAAGNWIRKNLNRESLKGYARAAARWVRELPKQLTKENFKKWTLAFWHWLCSLPVQFRAQRKYALLASCALLALWLYLGSATTLAWFTDITPTARNSFVVGELDLRVHYKNDEVPEYTEMTEDSAVFNDEALYEPGYTQVVYLMIENKGTIDFNYKVSVYQHDYRDSINVYGQNLHLPDYLRFGMIVAATEHELQRKVAQELAGEKMSDYPLGEVLQPMAPGSLKVNGAPHYAALIVWMPEEVDNHANYRTGEVTPQVQLGVKVYAQQADTPMD